MAKKPLGSAQQSGLNRWKSEQESAEKTDAGKSKRPRSSSGKGGKSPAARRYRAVLLVLLVAIIACVALFWPPAERITQGLDIQGGVSVILTASKPDGSAVTSEDMAIATSIVQNRVNSLGASETTVQQQGTSSILVQIPGATDADAAVETIGRTGRLEFVRLDEIGDADALKRIRAGAEQVQLQEGTYTAFMDGSSITSTSIGQSSQVTDGYYAVNLKLDSEGTRRFAEVTSELAPYHGQIAIVLDGVVYSAPAVQSVISTGEVSITGRFTLEDANALKTVLDSGSLPVTLTYSESRVVGPTLGQDSLAQGVFALLVGAIIVIVYLFVFYNGLGLLTFGSLAVFLIVYLGILAVLSHFGAFALTLPGLAGMVLTTGTAADSSILVLERFREEIRMGKGVKAASISGVKHGIMTSLDADVVTLVSALALFFVAVGPVKGFGLTLALGILCDVITMFFFKAPALRLLAAGPIQKNPKLWGVKHDLDEAEAITAARAAARKGGVANA